MLDQLASTTAQEDFQCLKRRLRKSPVLIFLKFDIYWLVVSDESHGRSGLKKTSEKIQDKSNQEKANGKRFVWFYSSETINR